MAYKVTEPTIWFFTTVEERNATGIPRCKLLPDQYVPDGKGGFEPCDTSLNVQTATEPRKANKIGTIFAAKGCRKTQSPAASDYYTTDKENLISMGSAVSSDIKDAYKEYLASAGQPIPAELEDATATPKVVGKSLIDTLMRDFPLPTVGTHNFYVRPDLWASLLFNVSKGYNTMLVGESGTGKTELAMLLANIMKKTCKVFDMSAKQDPIASLIGVHRFADGKSIFDRADFTFELEKENNIVVFDELPRAPMNTNNILFPILDSRRELTMDIASSELRSIKVNPTCQFIATANDGFRYTGNNVIDAALKERFQLLIIDFMPQDNEADLLVKRAGIGKKDAMTIVKVCTQIRMQAAKDELSCGVSVRHSLFAADMLAGGFNLSQAMESAFLPMYNVEDEKKKVKDMLSGR